MDELDRARISLRLPKDDVIWLRQWAQKQSRAAGETEDTVGLSGAIRAAITAFRTKGANAAFNEGHAQGLRHVLATAKPQMAAGMKGMLAGLEAATPKK